MAGNSINFTVSCAFGKAFSNLPGKLSLGSSGVLIVQARPRLWLGRPDKLSSHFRVDGIRAIKSGVRAFPPALSADKLIHQMDFDSFFGVQLFTANVRRSHNQPSLSRAARNCRK